jgi:hypothetical protein
MKTMSTTQIKLGAATTDDQAQLFDEEPQRPFDDKDGREDAMEAELDELVSQLVDDAEAARDSAVFKEWLQANSAFHDYSARNSMLIQIQHPGAKRVAGYNTWANECDRHVKEGESAIWIWRPNTVTSYKCPHCGNAPNFHKDNDELDCELADTDPDEWNFQYTDEWERGEILCGFSPAPVYALEQTEGEELPELPTEATGEADLVSPMAAAGEKLGHNVEVVPTEEWARSAAGTCTTHTEPAEISVEDGRPAEVASVLAHEIAHAELHTGSETPDKAGKEVEAEAVACIVAEHFGLNATEGSAFYLASWLRDTDNPADEIKDRLTRIKQTARTIISAVKTQQQ